MQAQALLWRMMATIRRPGSLRDQSPCLMEHRQCGLWMWEEASAAVGQFSCEPKAVLNNIVN